MDSIEQSQVRLEKQPKKASTINNHEEQKVQLEKKEEFIPLISQQAKKPCTCKKTNCLKLYCQCFQNGEYCSPQCLCKECYNNADHAQQRHQAIELILQKDPCAFNSKVEKTLNDQLVSANNKKTCTCKKSKCSNKYCSCFVTKKNCTQFCKCTACANPFGQEDEIEQVEKKVKIDQ